jgi:hypothetical protein
MIIAEANLVILFVIFRELLVNKLILAKSVDIIVDNGLNLLSRFTGHTTLLRIEDRGLFVDELMQIEEKPGHVLRRTEGSCVSRAASCEVAEIMHGGNWRHLEYNAHRVRCRGN